LEKTKNEDYKSFLVALLLAVAACGLFPFYPVFAVFVPFVFACLFIFGGYLKGSVGIVFCLLAAYAIDPVSCTVLAVAFIPPAAAAGYAVRTRLRFRSSVIAASTAALCGAALLIGILWLVTQQGPADYLAEAFGRSLAALGDETVKAFYQIFRYSDVLTGTVTQSALQAASAADALNVMQAMVKDIINLVIVSYIIIYALAIGLLLVVIARAFAIKRGLRVSGVPAFSEFSLPKRFWLAYMASVLVAYFGADFGLPGFDNVLLTIHSVYSFVFIIQGLVFLDFLYKKRSMGKGSRVTLHILIGLLAASLLMIVGLIENLFGLRKRLVEKGGTAS